MSTIGWLMLRATASLGAMARRWRQSGSRSRNRTWRGHGTRRRSGDGAAVRRVTFAVPGDITTSTGGYGYDRRIMAELGGLGWNVDLLPLGDGFPAPTAEQIAIAQARLLTSAPNRPVVIDGLAFSVLPEVAAMLHVRQPVVALIHHPLACETGLVPA